MRLYTTTACPKCERAKALYNGTPLDIEDNWNQFIMDAAKHGYTKADIRGFEAPVLVTDDMLFTGLDVVLELGGDV